MKSALSNSMYTMRIWDSESRTSPNEYLIKPSSIGETDPNSSHHFINLKSHEHGVSMWSIWPKKRELAPFGTESCMERLVLDPPFCRDFSYERGGKLSKRVWWGIWTPSQIQSVMGCVKLWRMPLLLGDWYLFSQTGLIFMMLFS